MMIKIDRDILVGISEEIKNYFLIQEFTGTKITSYQKALYNALLKSINGKKKDELFK